MKTIMKSQMFRNWYDFEIDIRQTKQEALKLQPDKSIFQVYNEQPN